MSHRVTMRKPLTIAAPAALLSRKAPAETTGCAAPEER